MVLSCVMACVFSLQPLASTGAEDGIWFVGDRNPAQIQFDAKAKGLEYSICARTSTTTYASLQSFLRRPTALTLYNNELWFVDQRNAIALYAMRNKPTGELYASLQSTYETQLELRGLHQWGDVLALNVGGSSLQVVTYDGHNWEELPVLEEKDARTIVYKNNLLAFVPTKKGAHVWQYGNGEWESKGLREFTGTLGSIIQKNDWLLLVTEHEGDEEVFGLQKEQCILSATFSIPKGRWSVVPSPEGLSLVSVERNGTTTVVDMGWPSGRQSPAIELTLEPLHATSFLQQVALFLPMFLFVGFAFLLLRSGNAKSTQ